MDNVTFQPKFDKETAEKIKQEAAKVGAKAGPYIASLIKAHIAKQETDRPFTHKQEYK